MFKGKNSYAGSSESGMYHKTWGKVQSSDSLKMAGEGDVMLLWNCVVCTNVFCIIDSVELIEPHHVTSDNLKFKVMQKGIWILAEKKLWTVRDQHVTFLLPNRLVVWCDSMLSCDFGEFPSHCLLPWLRSWYHHEIVSTLQYLLANVWIAAVAIAILWSTMVRDGSLLQQSAMYRPSFLLL